MKYFCNHCGGSINISSKTVYEFCPICGSKGTLERRNRGRVTALENRAKILELIPELERTRADFLECFQKYQKIQMALATSKMRGNISEEEIPKYIPQPSYRTIMKKKAGIKK